MASIDYVAKYGNRLKTACEAVAKPVVCCICKSKGTDTPCGETLARCIKGEMSYFCGKCYDKDLARVTKRAIQARRER